MGIKIKVLITQLQLHKLCRSNIVIYQHTLYRVMTPSSIFLFIDDTSYDEFIVLQQKTGKYLGYN